MPEHTFIQAKHFTNTSRTKKDIDLLVVHDMEFPERSDSAEAIAKFFQNIERPASAHYCLAPETEVLRDDLRWVPASSLSEGDGIIGVDEFARGTGSGRCWREGQVIARAERETERVRVVLEDGREAISSADHFWLVSLAKTSLQWVAADSLKPGDFVSAPLDVWDVPDASMSWLAGVIDGEGTWTNGNDLTFAQKDGRVFERARALLDQRNLPYTFHKRPDTGVNVLRFSGMRTLLRVLGEARPERFVDDHRWVGRSLRSRVYDHRARVVAVEHEGLGPVVSLGTSIRTMVANGLVAHNCLDINSVVQCVKDEDIAYAAPGANHNGIQVEFAGFAVQDRNDWLDDYGTKMLTLGAKLFANKADQNDIPIQWLRPEDLRAGRRGLTSHWNVTLAFRESTHTDPGRGFPIDWFVNRVRVEAQDKPRKDLRDWPKTIKKGAKGWPVKRAQRRLRVHGFYQEPLDNVFGKATEKAVVRFQHHRHLKADGVVGDRTWAALFTDP